VEITSPVVFDAEPLLAYLDDEPGATAVRQVIEAVQAGDCDGYISYSTRMRRHSSVPTVISMRCRTHASNGFEPSLRE
jgi:hypothetical protein